ncbi:MAG: hypothetical protein D6820_10955 [Lentisphaerae bacterium]|nr:MAG: hypothetical protein D6820_10955 [Lentisphaerota bacterium]
MARESDNPLLDDANQGGAEHAEGANGMAQSDKSAASSSEKETASRKHWSWWGAMAGLIIAVLFSTSVFLNDMVMHNTPLIGHYLPVGVTGIVLVLVLIGLVFSKIRKRRMRFFSGRSLGLVVIYLLLVCGIAGRGFLDHFTTTLVLPYHLARITPGWQGDKTANPPKPGIVDQVPEGLLADVKADSEKVLDSFCMGNDKTTFPFDSLGCIQSSLRLLAAPPLLPRGSGNRCRTHRPPPVESARKPPLSHGSVFRIAVTR